LGYLLLQFAAEVVLLHPAARANGMRAHLFPLHGDEYTLEDAWRLLRSLKTMSAAVEQEGGDDGGEGGVARDATSASESTASTHRATDQKAAAAARAHQHAADKARRNALLCSVVWRVHRNQQTFADAMRGLRGTIFALDVKPTSPEAELLEAIALMPEKEDSKVALLLEWTARQQSDLLNKLTDSLRRADALGAEEAALRAQLGEAKERVAALEGQLQSERASKEELDRHIGVVKTHGQADYEELRASSLRAIRDAVQQLEQVSVALGRDVPKVSFAREVLDTIVDFLRATTKKLEDA
jgi:chromosome segregation ATPase